MKFFNSQNTSNSKWKGKEFLIYFINSTGGFNIYRYNRNTGEHSPAQVADLLGAKNIYVSYSYLGGIHLSNYSSNKTKVGALYTFSFTLGHLSSVETAWSPGESYWDIPNAVFLEKSNVSTGRGIEPVKAFSFQILATNPTVIHSTSFTTFTDTVLSQGGRRYETEIGVWRNGIESTNHLFIREYPEEEIIYRDSDATNTIYNDFKFEGSTEVQSYSAGHGYYESEESYPFIRDYDLIAAFPCYFRVNNAWERRIYFIANNPSGTAFNINATPAQTCYGYYIKQSYGQSIVFNTVDFFGYNTPIAYYNLDNLIS